MMKFLGKGENGLVFYLGLSRANVDRFTAGEPIALNLADMGGPPVDVVLLFTETDRELFEMLKEGGLLPPDAEYQEPAPGETRATRFKP